MVKRYIILIAAGLILLSSPVFAGGYQPSQGNSGNSSNSEAWTFGGGYYTLPSAKGEDDDGNKLDTAGLYASMAMRSTSYMIEGNYAVTGTHFFSIAADYVYPLGQSSTSFSNTFIGLGYTYFTSDEFDKEKGLNVVAGTTFGQNIIAQMRYDFLGGSQEMLTIGLQYQFQ